MYTVCPIQVGMLTLPYEWADEVDVFSFPTQVFCRVEGVHAEIRQNGSFVITESRTSGVRILTLTNIVMTGRPP